jgi:hypothetical protein
MVNSKKDKYITISIHGQKNVGMTYQAIQFGESVNKNKTG